MIEMASHLGICVADLERACGFYRDALGFVESARLRFADEATRTLLSLPDGVLEAVYLDRDGWRVELLHFPEPGTVAGAVPRPMNLAGLTHLSFVAPDLDAAIAAVEAHGGRLIAGTRLDGAAMVTDPDGTRIELMRRAFDPVALQAAAGPSGEGG